MYWEGRTALHCAIGNGHLETAKYLIETCHVDKDAKDWAGLTALHIASEYGHLETVKHLIEKCNVNKEAITDIGWTALHCASCGHLEIVQYLIEICNADKEAKDSKGRSAYDLAMEYNKSEVAQYLLKVRSTPTSATPLPLREKDATSNQPAPTIKEFLNAAREGDLIKVKYCVNNGIDKDAKDNDKWTAMHYATWKGYLEILKYLIETCKVDKDAKTNEGNTALHIASRNDHLDIITYLIETCDVNKEVRNNVGQTAYDVATAKNKKGEVARYLFTVSEDTTRVNDHKNVSTTLLENAALDQVRCVTLFHEFPVLLIARATCHILTFLSSQYPE